LSGLKDMGFTEATPIQEQAIPLILKGHDLIACAQTGTGKTAAFLVPMIDILDGISGAHIKALVLCPTRELATQSDEACEGLAYHSYVRSFPVFGGNKGGEDFNRQKAAFQQGADIVIATPGRLLQHISLGYVDLTKLEFLVLDEADRMLDMGFISDIRRIITYCNAKRQSLLFSATMPPKIRELAQEILFEPLQISIAISKPAEGISQKAYCVYDNQKVALVQHLFKTANVDSVIIFASRKQSVDRITKALNELGLDARGMHSDRDQSEREEIVNAFKNKQFPIMVATDIMSRGIDIDQLSHVINYDVPGDPEDYVHRIGRTARRETTGEAITFITEDEMSNFARIEKMIEREVEKIALPEALGQGPEYDPTRRPSRGGFDRRGGGGAGKQRGGGGGNRGGNNRGGQVPNQNQGRNNGGRDNRQRQPQVQGNPQEGNPQIQPNPNQGPKQAPVQGPGRGPNPQNRSNQPRPQGQNQGQGQGQQNQGPRNNNNPQGGQNTDPNRKKKKKKPNSGEPKEFRNSQGEVIEKQPPRVFLASSDDVGLPVKKNNKSNHRKTGKKKDGSPAAPTYIAPGE
jgi:ATP-dependent RNA helicase RhlE